jgi:hypothetical protein
MGQISANSLYDVSGDLCVTFSEMFKSRVPAVLENHGLVIII